MYSIRVVCVMFYKIGSTDNGFDFIYDSEDGSCEMIKASRLKELGVSLESRDNVWNFNKFRLMYNLDSDINIFHLVSYNISISNNLFVSLSVNLFVEKINGRYIESHGNSQIARDPYLSDHIIVLDINLSSVVDSSQGIQIFMRDYEYDTKGVFGYLYYSNADFVSVKHYGVSIPVEMFVYTMKLARSHDINSLSRAYGDWLIKNFKLSLSRGLSSIKFAGNVQIESIDAWGV